MIEVRSTPQFTAWLAQLRDIAGKARILKRINRAAAGNLGDVKYFDGIGEMRIDVGPGYRVYFVRRGSEIVILLSGGDKDTQDRDIKRAKLLAKETE